MFSLVLRLSSAGQGPSRTECGYPALSLPLSLTPTLPASGFPKPVQKVRFRVAREIWALIKTATGMQQSASVARLAQSVEHETLNLRVVGSSPTLGLSFGFLSLPNGLSVSSTSLDLSLLMQNMCGMHSVGILASALQRIVRRRSLWRNWLARSAVNRKDGGSIPPRDEGSFSLPSAHVSANFRI